jgi:sec-independent protein translocase protein TatB
MFDIAFSEMVVIGLVALLVLGPKRLPELARTAGRWIAGLRRFIDSVKREVDREVRSDDLEAFRKLQQELDETRNLLHKSAGDTLHSLSQLQVNPEPSPAPIGAASTPTIAPAASAPPAETPGKAKRARPSKKAVKKHGGRKAKR